MGIKMLLQSLLWLPIAACLHADGLKRVGREIGWDWMGQVLHSIQPFVSFCHAYLHSSYVSLYAPTFMRPQFVRGTRKGTNKS